jgi:hypothetical protein
MSTRMIATSMLTVTTTELREGVKCHSWAGGDPVHEYLTPAVRNGDRANHARDCAEIEDAQLVELG